MKKLQFAALAAAFVLGAFALAACGGSDSSQDEDDITAAIETAATTTDASKCTEVQTENFTNQTDGSLEDCQKNAADGVSDSVEVSNVEVDGDTASADAALTGGSFDGQTLDLELVKEGDVWKVDNFAGFTEFDREAFVSGFNEEIAADPNTPPQLAECFQQQIDQATDQQLQDVFLTENGAQELFSACEG